MLSRENKHEVINQLNEKFKTHSSVFVLSYKGLTVKELEGIRKDLREVNSEFRIAKNSLLKKAAEETDAQEISDYFVGTTAVAFCHEDSTSAAKVFVKSSKEFENLIIKGGLIEGKKVDVSEIEKISKLPSRTELIGQFAGLLTSPMSNLLYSLNNMQAKLVYALNSLKNKKEEENKEQ